MVRWRKKKILLLLGKFGAAEQEKYANFILLRNPGEILFQETTNINKNIREAVFIFQYTMAMHESYKENKDYTTFASIANSM